MDMVFLVNTWRAPVRAPVILSGECVITTFIFSEARSRFYSHSALTLLVVHKHYRIGGDPNPATNQLTDFLAGQTDPLVQFFNLNLFITTRNISESGKWILKFIPTNIPYLRVPCLPSPIVVGGSRNFDFWGQ